MSETTVTTFAGEAAVSLRCWCSVHLAVPRSLYDYYIRREGAFALHCPLGHEFIPSGQSPSQREALAQRLRAERAEADAARQREAKLRAMRQSSARKGIATRMRNRLKRGVCPCCSKKFPDLHAHMKQRHPKWDPEKAVGALAGGT